jgi:hypothetical protein
MVGIIYWTLGNISTNSDFQYNSEKDNAYGNDTTFQEQLRIEKQLGPTKNHDYDPVSRIDKKNMQCVSFQIK